MVVNQTEARAQLSSTITDYHEPFGQGFTVVKIYKKNFLQLSCSDVLLHLKYKVLLCEPKIEFNNLAGGKALASDHHGGKCQPGTILKLHSSHY